MMSLQELAGLLIEPTGKVSGSVLAESVGNITVKVKAYLGFVGAR